MPRFSTTTFSLVLVRHPDGRFGVVQETDGRGLWISGGHVEEGESFEEAALREAQEELGVAIRLKGIIRVEHSLTGQKSARTRVIFVGEPLDPAAPLKTVPDAESEGGLWMTRDEVNAAREAGQTRGDDFVEIVNYIADGGAVYPLSVLTPEGAPLAPLPPRGPTAGSAPAAAGGAAAGASS